MSCTADQVTLKELSSASKLVIFLLRVYKVRPNSFVTGNVFFSILKYTAFWAMSLWEGLLQKNAAPILHPAALCPHTHCSHLISEELIQIIFAFLLSHMHFQFFFQCPQLCSQCRAVNLSGDSSADRGGVTRQPFLSVKYLPSSSPAFFFLLQGGGAQVVLC